MFNLYCILYYIVIFAAQLHKNLQHYELIDASEIGHKMVKRGAKPSTHPFNTIKEVEFQTLGRNFRLILHPQKDVLHSNFKAYTVDADGNETVIHVGEYLQNDILKRRILIIIIFKFLDHGSIYSGRVFGESQSSVRAHIDDGIMTASIVLPDETYHIEVNIQVFNCKLFVQLYRFQPSWRHVPHLSGRHMIAYKASDIKLSWQHHHKLGEMGVPKTCGYVKEGLGKLEFL